MRNAVTSMALAGVLSLASGMALSQPMMASGGPMRGPGAGPGMMGGGGWGFADPAGYLDSLKSTLGITATQEPAWNEYAAAVKGAAEQMQDVHKSMYEAMGTATWQERRDMMNRMFESRQQAFNSVHAAAEKLLPTLDAAQRTKAETRLPGLVGPGYHMMGRMGGMGPGSRVR